MNNRLREKPPSTPWAVHDWTGGLLLIRQFQFDDLNGYLQSTQTFILREQETLRGRVSAARAAFQKDKPDELYDEYGDSIEWVYNTFPELAYSSIVVMTCSLFEVALVDACKRIDKDFDRRLTVPWSEDPSKRLDAKRKADGFLRSNFGIELSSSRSWNNTRDIYLIRNCIVHAGANLSLIPQDKRQATIQALSRQQAAGVKVSDDNRISFDTEFVSFVINSLRTFWQELCDACMENAILGERYWPSDE